MRIAHRELVLANVVGSTAFTVQSYLRLNPGLATTFPWLAPQGTQWDQYKVHKLRAVYVPIAPTSTQGDVILSPNYDPSDPPPTSEQQSDNNAGTVITPCWKGVTLQLDPKALMGSGPRRFIRTQNVAGDIKTFDVGTIAVCTNNQTGNGSPLGKIYLEYDFEFFMPQSDPPSGSASLYTSMFANEANLTIGNAANTYVQFATPDLDPLGFNSTGNTAPFTPPAGTYRILCNMSCTDSVSEQFTAVLTFWKNGAPTTPLVEAVSRTPGVSNAGMSLSVTNVLSFSGSDTFGVIVNLQGATGALTIAPGNAQLIVSLA